MSEIITRAAAKARGLKRYFTGNPCKHGHISERRVSGGICIVCHREEIKLARRRYPKRQLTPKQKAVKAQRAHVRRIENPGKNEDQCRRWRANNIQKRREQDKRHYARHYEKVQQKRQKAALKSAMAREIVKRLGIQL